MRILDSAILAAGLLVGASGAMAADIAPTRFSMKEKSPVAMDNPATKKVMKRLTAGGSNVYGYVGWDLLYEQDNPATQVGALYNFGANGYTVKWNDPMWTRENSLMRTGYLVYDKDTDRYVLTGTVPVYYWGNPDIISVCYYTYDFETGKMLRSQFPDFEEPYFLNAAYNENDGYVYGLAEYRPAENKKPFYGRAKVTNLNNIEKISNLNVDVAFVSICWNSDDGYIYGILPDGAMMRVDNEGKTTQVAYFKEPIAEYQTGLAYSPVEKIFYWNVNFPNGTSSLYTIDLSEGGQGKFTYLYDFPHEEEFYFFVTTDKPANPKAPAVGQIKDFSFPNGATDGSITFVMPRKKADNTTINPEASMRYQVRLDGEDSSGGSARAGEEVKIDFIDLPQGMHEFSFTTSLDGISSLPCAREAFIGVDTPKAPEGVYMTTERVTWEAVTEGVHNGYVDMDNLVYEVYVDGELAGTTKDYQLDITINPATEIHNMCSKVVAVAGDKRSEPGVSNYIVAGKARTLPVFFAPTADDAAVVMDYDGNFDGNGWNYSSVYDAWVCKHSLESKGDDWLFLPPVEITDASKYYVLTFESKIVNAEYPDESMEVTIGNSTLVTDQTQVVMKPFTPSAEYSEYQGLIKVDEPGVYNLAFHYVSAPMQNGIFLRSVGISDKGLDPATPKSVAEIKTVPAAEGKLEATVSFAMPTQNIADGTIDPSKTMTATVSTSEGSVEVSGKAGEEMNTVVPTAQGDNQVSVIVTLDGNTGLKNQAAVYTGLDIPSEVTDLRAEVSADMMSVNLTWGKPVKGEHNGYVSPDGLTYDVYIWTVSMWGPSWEKIGTAGSDLSYTYTFSEGSAQDFYEFGIRPINAAGKSPRVTFTAQVAGTPYSVPMVEDFAKYDTDFSILPWMMVYPTDAHTGSWNVTPVNDFDSTQEGYLLVAGGPRGAKARVTVPRFSSENAEQLFVNLTLFGGDDTNGLDIYAYDYDITKPEKIGSAPANTKEGFYKATVELPAKFLGKKWVALELDASFPTNNSITALRRLEVSNTNNVGGAVEETLAVMGGKGVVTVFGAEGRTLDLYTIDGRKAAHVENASAVETINVPAGIYLLNGEKIIVR